MAVVAIEGFDYYPSITGGLGVSNRWEVITGSSSDYTLVTGRFPDGQALGVVGSNGILGLKIPTGSNFTIGLAFNFSNMITTDMYVVSLYHYDSASHRDQVTLVYNSTDGVWKINRAGTTEAQSDPVTINLNTWYYVELEVTISKTDGTARLLQDGLERLNATGLNTSNWANSTVADYVTLHSRTSVNMQIDDLYVTNNKEALGPTRVIMTYPDADSAQKDFDNSEGDGSNFDKLNSVRADADDYIRADATGARDAYGMSDLPYNPVKIHAIQPVIGARKDKLNPRTLQLNLESGSTALSGVEFDLVESTTDFKLHFDTIRETDPDTGETWTTQGLNAVKLGPEIL